MPLWEWMRGKRPVSFVIVFSKNMRAVEVRSNALSNILT